MNTRSRLAAPRRHSSSLQAGVRARWVCGAVGFAGGQATHGQSAAEYGQAAGPRNEAPEKAPCLFAHDIWPFFSARLGSARAGLQLQLPHGAGWSRVA